jgi:hypothetical protein
MSKVPLQLRLTAAAERRRFKEFDCFWNEPSLKGMKNFHLNPSGDGRSQDLMLDLALKFCIFRSRSFAQGRCISLLSLGGASGIQSKHFRQRVWVSATLCIFRSTGVSNRVTSLWVW